MRINRADEIKIKELAEKYGRDPSEVAKAIESQYIFMKNKITDLDFDPNLTEEEFYKLKTNFNIPCIGKLYASFYMYRRINLKNGRRKEDSQEQ